MVLLRRHGKRKWEPLEGKLWAWCIMKGDSGHRAQGSVVPGKGHREGWFWAWDMGKGDSRHRAQQRLILVTGYREGRFFLPRLILCLLKSPNHLTLPSRLLLSTSFSITAHKSLLGLRSGMDGCDFIFFPLCFCLSFCSFLPLSFLFY